MTRNPKPTNSKINKKFFPQSIYVHYLESGMGRATNEARKQFHQSLRMFLIRQRFEDPLLRFFGLFC